MTPADRIIAETLLSHQIDLLRLSAYEQNIVLSLLDNLGRELEGKLRRDPITEFSKARIEALLKEATDIIDRYYADIVARTDGTLAGVANLQPTATLRAASLVVTVDASLPTETFLKRLISNAVIQGAKSAEWWARQNRDTAFRFAAAVRQGLAQQETNEQIVSRIVGTQIAPGIMETSKRNARSLIHASIQQVANDARLETFRKNADVIKGVRQLSTLDSHTTDICIAYSGSEWDLNGDPINETRLPFNGGPPRHWGCRSILTPITKTFKELGVNIEEPTGGERAATGGPVDRKITMKQWLDSRTEEQLDEQLGKGRAELFRSGKITLTQLLDLRGNPLTLAQLESKYL